MNTQTQSLRTNSKQVKTAIQQYIIDSIDTSNDIHSGATLKEQLEFICSEFKRVACYHYNWHHFKNSTQAMFIDWFKGMPSYFNISVYHNEILEEIMPSFGLPLPSNKTEEQVIELFYALIYINFLDLCKKNNVNFYQYIR